MKGAENREGIRQDKAEVINVGLQSFYEAVEKQGVKVTQLEWRPPVKLKPEILALLDKLL